ncbi:unnamed protein product [Bursaphelenchus okinawaensis]|uniref:Uncharacterized protein n=1 Tax=Bursaphelenchus okinawaensis TaxID=465554 RepID=A0A811KW85_9BILA|nr:unnamed protein product [Bursaphelenchus okinawaensis]CAG9112351.1 unnamed protein product [Bursaphelenchus okinawaensis]
MANMYRIQPVLEDLVVKPNVSMYHIESIHGEVQIPSSNSVQSTSEDPVKDLERRQLELIRNLNEFSKTLDQYLSSDVSKLRSDVSKLSVQEGNATKAGGKVDKKAAKKEARNNNKSLAKEKKTPETRSESLLTLVHPPNSSTFNIKPNVEDPKVTIHDYKTTLPTDFEGVLECQVADIKWLNSLMKLGNLRGIAIGPRAKGKGTIHFKTTKGTVQLSGVSTFPITGRVSVWKALGTLLRVYDVLDGVSALETHEWLTLADSFLKNQISFDDFYRPINRRLSEVDYLASRSSLLLPDLLLKDLVNGHVVANNTELWINRVTSSL